MSIIPFLLRENWSRTLALTLLLACAGFMCSCSSPKLATRDAVPYSEIRLREGDVIKISFPGAPNLETTQQVRRDGKITLSLGGEVLALGKTPSELEKELLQTYESQLVVKQVIVAVTSSSFPVFVTGSVLKPGKINADRPISVLEAIMEAGGVDYSRANLEGVVILRQAEGGQVVNFKVDLKAALKGPRSDPFYLKPADIVYVPEKFSWF